MGDGDKGAVVVVAGEGRRRHHPPRPALVRALPGMVLSHPRHATVVDIVVVEHYRRAWEEVEREGRCRSSLLACASYFES